MNHTLTKWLLIDTDGHVFLLVDLLNIKKGRYQEINHLLRTKMLSFLEREAYSETSFHKAVSAVGLFLELDKYTDPNDLLQRHEERVIIISSKDNDNNVTDAENALQKIATLILQVIFSIMAHLDNLSCQARGRACSLFELLE